MNTAKGSLRESSGLSPLRRRGTLLLLIFCATIAMGEPQTDLQSLFEAELASRGIEFRLHDDGQYELRTDDGTSRTISIESLARRLGQSGDEAAVQRFLDSALAGVSSALPRWETARASVFPMLQGAEFRLSEDEVKREMSDEAVAVLVFYDEAAGFVRFIRSSDLDEWGVTEEQAWAAAEEVLDRVMSETDVGYLDAGELRLGTIEAFEPWKASLIRSRVLRDKVEDELGWPVYAVAPDRGFVYLLSRDDADQLGRIGAVVVREYLEAPYPISTEVWEVSDEGIKAIGAFPTE